MASCLSETARKIMFLLKPWVPRLFETVQTYFADKVAFVRKLICYFLTSWFALLAGGANAHSISGLVSEAEHVGHVHSASAEKSTKGSVERASADLGDTCSQSHCGHGHSTGMLTSSDTYTQLDVAADAPLSSSRWASAAIADNIERPKWLLTTPAVVNLLS